MSGAILQGVPASTLDTDLGINLPPRQYIRVLNLCRSLGGMIRANTVVELTDGSLVNFLYEVHGLRAIRTEYREARLPSNRVARHPLKASARTRLGVPRRPTDHRGWCRIV